MRRVVVEGPLTLGQLLKLAGIVTTGGAGKKLVTSGVVRVNGIAETRRGRKINPGDIVETPGEKLTVIRE